MGYVGFRGNDCKEQDKMLLYYISSKSPFSSYVSLRKKFIWFRHRVFLSQIRQMFKFCFFYMCGIMLETVVSSQTWGHHRDWDQHEGVCERKQIHIVHFLEDCPNHRSVKKRDLQDSDKAVKVVAGFSKAFVVNVVKASQGRHSGLCGLDPSDVRKLNYDKVNSKTNSNPKMSPCNYEKTSQN